MDERINTQEMADLYEAHRGGRLHGWRLRLFNHIVAIRCDLVTLQADFDKQYRSEVWFSALRTPFLAAGKIEQKIVAVRHPAAIGDPKVAVFAAWYLNAFPLSSEDGCLNEGSLNGDPCPCENGEGCPQTGWHQDTPSSDFEMFYEPIGWGDRELLGWKDLPTWIARDIVEEVKGALNPTDKSRDLAGGFHAVLVAIDHMAESSSDHYENLKTIGTIRKIAQEARAVAYPAKKEVK